MARRWLLVTLLLFSVTGCSGEIPQVPVTSEPVAVVVGPTLDPINAPIYVAAAKGYFRDEGLRVKLRTFPSGADALDAAIAHEIDFAACAETPIARAMLADREFEVLATIAETSFNNKIIARKDLGIVQPGDLAGKRVGVVPGSSADFFLHIYLTAQGVDRADVDVVPTPADSLPDKLLKGEIDAASTWAPHTFRLESELGPDALVLQDPGLYTTYWQVATSKDAAAASTNEAFLRALLRAERFLQDEPAESQRIVAERSDVSTEQIREAWGIYRWHLRLDQALLLAIEDEVRWMRGESGPVPDFSGYLDPAPLKSIRPSSVDIVDR